MLKIWGNTHSSCAQKVLVCAAELDLPFELIKAGGGYGGLDTPEYAALNPNKLIPTIDDGGTVLWESGAILCYLASTYGQASLYPDDPAARGDAYRWVFWQTGTVRAAIMPLYVQWEVWKPAYRHMEELERLRRGMEGTWRIVDDHLSDGRPYLAGASYTIGDIAMGIMAHWWYRFPIEHFDLPHMRAWHDRVVARPAFQEYVVTPLAEAARE